MTNLGKLENFAFETPTKVSVDDVSYVVVRSEQTPDKVCVFLDRCPHAGLSLTKGPRGGYDDGVITCPWHNSRFDICTGENLDWTPGVAGVDIPRWSRKLLAMGKKPQPLTMFDVTVEDGDIIVSPSPRSS